MQHSGDLGLCCILGPDHRQRPYAARRVPSIAIVKLDQKVHTLYEEAYGLRPVSFDSVGLLGGLACLLFTV